MGHSLHARPRLDLQRLGIRVSQADAGPQDYPRRDRRRGRVGEGHPGEDGREQAVRMNESDGSAKRLSCTILIMRRKL